MHSLEASTMAPRAVPQSSAKAPFLHVVFLVLLMFPFTQIIELPTYNQPYAFLAAGFIVLIKPSLISNLPQTDRLMLGFLALLGCILFLFGVLDGLKFRELSFLLSYLTPFVTTVAGFWAVSRHPASTRRILVGAIIAWTGLGVIQTVWDPNFLTFLAAHTDNLGENIVLSGRGALGFAPEPTHFGFHMVMLAAMLHLLRGPIWVVALALLTSLLIAKSSSVLLALAVGLILWAAVKPIRRAWIFAGILMPVFFSGLVPLIFDDSYRITQIILRVYYNGFDIFLLDYSVNARLSGMFAPLYLFVDRAFMPLGMSIDSWLEARLYMLGQFPWMIDLSGSGPASGFGLILLQGGLFAVPASIYFIRRFIFDLGAHLSGLFTAVSFFIFMGQYLLATPTFGLLLAIIIYRKAET